MRGSGHRHSEGGEQKRPRGDASNDDLSAVNIDSGGAPRTPHPGTMIRLYAQRITGGVRTVSTCHVASAHG
ncbi:MAG TPA: hypothetical protein DEW39_06255 [Brevibacterium sp.]|nr:hypothetical protein [Brevibacterium sp.]